MRCTIRLQIESLLSSFKPYIFLEGNQVILSILHCAIALLQYVDITYSNKDVWVSHHLFFCIYFYPPTPTLANTRKDSGHKYTSTTTIPKFSFFDVTIFVLTYWLVLIFLSNCFLNLCTSVEYITLSTNLSTKPKRRTPMKPCLVQLILTILLVILLNECKDTWYLFLLNSDIKLPSHKLAAYFKLMINKIFISVRMFYTLFNPDISICSLYWLIVTEGYCDTYWKESGQYLMIMLIILSNDVHKNPGPFQNSYFTFMISTVLGFLRQKMPFSNLISL